MFSSPVFARSQCKANGATFKAINQAAQRHNLPVDLLLAIAQIESCYGKYRFNSTTKDYGLMQVNHRTAKALGYSTSKLLVDDAYNLDAAARVLLDLQKHWPDWPCRYNVGTSHSPTTARRCKTYLARLIKAGYRPSSL